MSEEWTKPFVPDKHTVALYHFDEGKGNEAHDACGDNALILRANKVALWGKRQGFGSTARFTRREDDANLLIGPVNNDKLELRTCTKEWTIEAWVKYTGLYNQDDGHTFANICGSDEEGFSLPEGKRGGWNFTLYTWKQDEKSLAMAARWIGPKAQSHESGTSSGVFPYHNPEGVITGATPASFCDENWHHVAWQFRFADQMHFLFLDGRLIWKVKKPYNRPVMHDAEGNDIPFHVGGLLHSQNPPYFLNYGNFEGEIDELRISSIMRYPVAEKLAIVQSEFPDAGLQLPYSYQLAADGSDNNIHWEIVKGSLPEGLYLKSVEGDIEGIPLVSVKNRKFSIRATDTNGQKDEHTFSLAVKNGAIITDALPVGFAGLEYNYQIETEFMAKPVKWEILSGQFPEGIIFDKSSGLLHGTAQKRGFSHVKVQAVDANEQSVQQTFTFKVVPHALRRIKVDKNTVVLYDWQGTSGKLIKDKMEDENLTLTWVNMKGDTRLPRTGWGVYPRFIGGGENGFAGPKAHPKLDMKTCGKEWTVEAWVRRGGRSNSYFKKHMKRHFDFGHICGTYDSSEQGVWELYLSDHDSPDSSMSPGVHFLGAEKNQALMDIHPWKRPEGIVCDRQYIGIHDTEWHHVAWQYNYKEDLHQLFLDGVLIWQMKSPDGRKLVNNRKHNAQFSVGARIKGYVRYGYDEKGGFSNNFNFLGWGHFFGQIGEIRISNVRRYSNESSLVSSMWLKYKDG